MAIRTVAVCAGYGGLELGLRLAGLPIQLVAVVERQAYAAAVIADRMVRRAVDPCPIWDDMESFPSERFRDRVDLVVGGIPCQGASVAGKRKGVDDERWLWPTFWRVVQQCGAPMLLLENVPGLLNVNKGRAFQEILDTLAASGWIAEWDCFPAAAVGAPHIRDRIFLLAADPNRVDVRILAERDQQLAAEWWHSLAVHDGGARDVPHADDERDAPGQQPHGDGARARGEHRTADTDGERRETDVDAGGSRSHGGDDAARGGGPQDVADTDSDGLQGERHGGELERGERAQQRHVVDRCSVSPRWSSVVGWPAPQPAFRGVDDGAADGLDVALSYAWAERIHLLGNGVVPQAACAAIISLAERIVL